MNNDDAPPPQDELAAKRGRKGKGKKAKAEGAPEAADKPKRERKPKQTQIPGTERHDKHPDIERAATEYADVRDTRMQWTKKEVAAREVLRDKMKEHKLTIYECDEEDLTVELIPAKEEKVKVKRRADDDDDDDAAEAD